MSEQQLLEAIGDAIFSGVCAFAALDLFVIRASYPSSQCDTIRAECVTVAAIR